MPRPFSGAQRNAIKASSYNLHWKVEVQSAAGAWQDMGGLGGLDWNDKAAWSDSIDNPTMDGTLSFIRESGVLSLAPLIASAGNTINNPGGSYSPAIEGARPVRISVAYPAVGVAPIAGDYIEVFLGLLSTPSWGGRDNNTLSGVIRDLGTLLMSRWSHAEKVYGGGVSLETCIQSILDDNIEPKMKLFASGTNGINAATGAVTLAFPGGGSGVVMSAFTFPVGPILSGLRDLAANEGWDVKFRYDAAGNFKLTLYLPPRGNVTPDATFDGDEYFAIPMFSIPDDDVRNNLDVYYTDGATGVVASINKQNAASITKYGERYHRLTMGAASPVNSAALATALATAVDNDLSLPYATQDVETGFTWFVQTTDLYQFAANGKLFDTAQNLAVVGYDHTLQGHDGTSVLHCRAQVAGLYKNWILLGSSGTGMPVPLLSPFTYVDTETTRVYSWVRNASTAQVWVYDNLLSVGSTDPYDVTGTFPTAPSPLPVGTDTWTTQKPAAGTQRAVHFVPHDSAGNSGTIRHEYIDPAPSPVSGTVRATGNNATADLTLHITGAASNWPVAVAVFEDDPLVSPIFSTTVNAVTDIPAIGTLIGRTLPITGVRTWYMRMVDVGGNVTWASGSAARVPVYSQALATVTAVTPTTITVTVSGSSPLGTPTVQLVGISGSASLNSGPAIGVAGNPSGTVWVFNRGAFQAGVGQAQFRATYAGTVTDDDFVDIPEIGRDTVYLASRARVTATSATTVTVRYAVADPFPQGANSATVTYQDQGSGGVAPASGGTITPDSTLTEVAGSFIDYTINRPSFSAGTARVTFTATASGRVSDSDAVDIPALERDTVGLASRARVTATSATTVTVRYAIADPFPQGANSATITYQDQGSGGVTPASGGTVTPASTLTEAAGTFIDYTITRPAFSAGTARVTFTATASNRTPDSDAVDVPAQERDTVSLVTRARVTASSATSVTVRYAVADPYPQGAGSATITYQDQGSGGVTPASGGTVTPAATLTEAAGTFVDYTITRPAFSVGTARVTFTATASGRTTSSDAIDIPAQERDTVALASRARVTASSATTVTVRFAVADPYPQGANSATLTYQDQGSGGVTPASGGTVTPASTLTEAAGTFVDYTITRPAFGAGSARVTFTATASNRITSSDAVDVPEQQTRSVTLAMGIRQAKTFPGPYNALDVTFSYSGMPAGTTFDVSYNNGVSGGLDAQTGVAMSASPQTVSFTGVTFAGSPGSGLVTVVAKDANGNQMASVTKGKPDYTT